MNDKIDKNITQIVDSISRGVSPDEIKIIKLILEKTYIQGVQEGSAEAFEFTKKLLNK